MPPAKQPLASATSSRPQQAQAQARSTPLRQVLDQTKPGLANTQLRQRLESLIVGQPDALEAILEIFQVHDAGLCANGRPVGNFLFLGPTGTGKTRTVEATCEALVQNPRALIKIDCSEFQNSHEIAKLIGSPPGYLGHRETQPRLSQEVLNGSWTDKVHLSFVLFDEVEKASDALWNLLLGILDKATLTLGDNRRVDFSRAMIFMTSNLGAKEMSETVQKRLGFPSLPTSSQADKQGKLTSVAKEAARRKFSPEFMNRLDKVVVFRPLDQDDFRTILDIELEMINIRIQGMPLNRAFHLVVSDTVKNHLLADGTNQRYGARLLKRIIDHRLIHPLSSLVASHQIRGGDVVHADLEPGATTITFSKLA